MENQHPTPATCPHLSAICEVTPRTNGCEECLKAGDKWMHLRMCLVCGKVGCCDESSNKHATGHFHETDHPMMRSIEPGENWVWCYVDRMVLYPLGDTMEGYEAATSEDFLRRISIFSELDKEDLDRIYGLARPMSISEGDALVRQGETGDTMYVILSGEFEVTQRSGGTDVVLSLIHI